MRIHTDQSESLLYWECGFLRQITDDTCAWINAQNNGRTEILRGEVIYSGHETLLEIKSSEFGNDSRMIASQRQLQVKKNQLTYTSHIATQDHPTLYLHLIATLERQDNL